MMNNEAFVKQRPFLPAEWEMEGAVLTAWPHSDTDWAYMLPEVQRCFKAMVTAMLPWTKVIVIAPDTDVARKYIGERENLFYFKTDTNDTWTRDYGPISIRMPDGSWRACDFRFNGWGMKFAACHDNRVVKHMSEGHLLTGQVMECQDFVLEGGGIESDGRGMLMTTAECQLSFNRNPMLSAGQIKDYLKDMFGAKDIIWLEHGYLAGDDTDSHIDTLARFAPNDTIVFTGCDDETDEHYTQLQLMEQELRDARTLDGRPFNLFRLPLPDAIYEDDERLPATYANFLVLPRAVIMPVYGQPKKDELARRIIEVAYERPVITVDCRALIRQHGSLHCMTMQIPKQLLPL